MADQVQPGWRTLETGCGLSSILLATRAAHHTIIAPDQQEHEAVRRWCTEHHVATDHVVSILEVSQVALPALRQDPLDVVLIDGGHAFPTPYIDWYYTAQRLKVGGYMVVDDMHIRTCAILRDFMLAEVGRWQLAAEVGRAVVFQKLSDAVMPADDYCGQPWVMNDELPSLRAILRPRTRLRRLGQRLFKS
ncbi:MAG: class I SAM-dependent methyltransferase [Candidatus Dormibacteraeota bacterium]|nr:class I SAM-dependent methyltransferase [Candidatus Dormibacteraeota bacterium]